MFLRQIFDPYLAQYAYLIGCQRTGQALLIDPERDIARYQDLARENGLTISAVAETHIHADFVSGAQEFAQDPEVTLYLSALGGDDWTYQWPADRLKTHFLTDGEEFSIGKIRVRAVHTPGHTPEHLSYLITDLGGGATQPMALVTGDFLFVGDVGRPDLLESAAGAKGVMEPAARLLGKSLRETLPPFADYVQVLPGHGAGSACGKSLGAVPTSTLGYERRFNGSLNLANGEPENFVREILAGQPEPPLYFARMKRVNRDGIRTTGGVPKAPHLPAAEFARLAAEGGVRTLDARDDRTAFDAAHTPNAIHAPLHGAFFTTSAGSYVGEDESILLVLEQAADLDLALRQLYRIGLDQVRGWLTASEATAGGLMTARQERVDFPDFRSKEALAEGKIIDVRTLAEFQDGHIEGALHFPYTRLAARLADLPRGKRLYIHCGSGKRAALAASYLQAEGFDTVHVDGECEECQRIAEAQGVAH